MEEAATETGRDENRALRTKSRRCAKPDPLSPSPVPEPHAVGSAPVVCSPNPVPKAAAMPKCLPDACWEDFHRGPNAEPWQ